METVEYIQLDYMEFDELVNANFPTAEGNYECIADQEWSNDSCYKFRNIKQEPLNEWNAKHIADGDLQHMARHLLTELCNKGVIQPGNYLITVSW